MQRFATGKEFLSIGAKNALHVMVMLLYVLPFGETVGTCCMPQRWGYLPRPPLAALLRGGIVSVRCLVKPRFRQLFEFVLNPLRNRKAKPRFRIQV